MRFAWLGLVILAPVCFLGLLEGILRVTGFGRDPRFFIRDAKPGMYRTNPRFTETFFPASAELKPDNFRIAREKPAGSARVFVLGESAAMGLPAPGFGLAAQLRAQLRAAYPGKSLEVYNLGIAAINSHVIRLIAAEAAQFQPDVFVVYMGNNEVTGPFGPGSAIRQRPHSPGWIRASVWLRSTRTGQLLGRIGDRLQRHRPLHIWRGRELFAGYPIAADDPRLATVYQNFEHNLADVVQSARSVHARVLLSTVATNLADCAPFASRHRTGMTAPDRSEWQRIYDDGILAADLGHSAEAEALFARALQLDPDYAEAEFRLARLLLARGDAAARVHFAQARQLDALRLRADDRINAIIRATAKAGGPNVVLVDSAEALGASATSSAPIAGHRLFFDHADLTWDGNFALAQSLAPAVAQALYGDVRPSGAWMGHDTAADRMGFTLIGRLMMLTRINELTEGPPFTGQITYAADRERLQQMISTGYTDAKNRDAMRQAVITIETALEADLDDAFLTFHAATANSEINNVRRALELNARLTALEPTSAEDLAQKGFLLMMAGRGAEAESVLLEATRLEPYYSQTYALLTQLWSNDKLGEARRYFGGLALRLPDFPPVRLAYADTLAASGEWTAAEQQWRAVLEQAPDNEAALDPLVRRLFTRNESDAALGLMLKAYAYNPRSFANNNRLVQAYAARGDRAKTAEFMGALAESGNVAPALHVERGSLLLELGRRKEAFAEFMKARRAAEAAGDLDALKRASAAIRDNNLD